MGRRGKEQVVLGIAQGQQAFEHQGPGHRADLVDTDAAGRSGAGENQAVHQLGGLQGDVLSDEAAE